MAKPLYEAVKGPGELLEWTPDCCKGFNAIKVALTSAPALGLPNLTTPFERYVHEREHQTLGILVQPLGSWKRPVAYFSKQLDEVSTGWPGYLRAVAAAVLLFQEARKLTLGQITTVYVPHAVAAVLEKKGHYWLSLSRMV